MVAQQQMLRNFRAKRAQGKGRRKFKSGKRSLPSLNYTRRGFVVKGARLCLAGGLSIPVVWSRELPSEPSSVRVYRDSIGLLALVYPGAFGRVLPLRRLPRLAISWHRGVGGSAGVSSALMGSRLLVLLFMPAPGLAAMGTATFVAEARRPCSALLRW